MTEITHMPKVNEQAGIVGKLTLTVCDVSSKKAQAMAKKLEELFSGGFREEAQTLKREFHRLFAVQTLHQHNIIPTVGLTVLAKAITSSLASLAEGEINYTSVGDDDTPAPALGDTQLNNEVFRKLVASLAYSNGIAYATAFYSASDFNDTIFEVGLHINGSGTVNSGVLFSHALINAPAGVTKNGTQTLTVDHEITFANA